MIAIMNEKGRQTKLLAAIAVLAMVVCVFAVVLPSEDANAEDPADPVVDGTSVTVYSDNHLETVIKGINSGSGEYANITTIYLGSESFGSTSDYTKYVIQKKVTIQPADGVTPTVYGGFVIYNVDDVVIKGIEICPDGEGNKMKTGVVVYASSVTITNCNFTLNTNALANGIIIYPKAPTEGSAFNYDITGNKFTGFINMNDSDYGSTAIGFAANCVLTFGSGYYFNGINGASEITSAKIDDTNLLQSIEIDLATENQYSNCFYIIGYDDWNGNGTNIGGTYVPGKIDADVVSSGSLATGFTNIIVPGQSIIISDDVEITGNLIVQGTLTIADGKELTANNLQIDSEGVVNVYGTLGGSGIVNNGTVRVLSQNASVPSMTGEGTVDTSAVSENATLSGRLLTSTTFTDRQIVTITDNLTLVSGTVLTIQGQLIIPEGVTVTIEDGAQLVIEGQSAIVDNNGIIVIQSAGISSDETGGLRITDGTFTNDGTIEAQYLPDTQSAGADQTVISVAGAFVNNGTVNIGTDSGMTITGVNGKFTNEAGSQLNMNGTLAVAQGKFFNAGTVNFNGYSSGVAIDLIGADASVNIESLTGSLQVTDDGYKTGNKKEFANLDSDNLVSLYGSDGFTIGGITVTTTTFTDDRNDDGTDEIYKALDISGTVSVVSSGNTADASSTAIRLVGEIVVSDTFNIGAGTTFKLGPNGGNANTNIQIIGTMNITANAANAGTNGAAKPFDITGAADMFVTGEIISQTNLTIAGAGYTISMNAAVYSVVASGITTFHYTTLGAAIESGATTIDTYGKITVSDDVTIANGVTVRQQAKSTIVISKDATVTVDNGGRITQNNSSIDVDGTLYIVDSRSGISGQVTTSGSESILSQVYSTNGTDARYTNLVNAMDAAVSGDTIKLYSKAVSLENTSFTIKEGVTVDTNGKDFKVYGTNLTINGTLFINGTSNTYTVGSYKVSDNYSAPSTVTLNGYLKFTESVKYSAVDLRFPAGAYYSMTENGVPYYYITTVANAAEVINDVVDNTVLIDGKLSVGSVTFTGSDDEQAIVDVAATANITSGTITLVLADLNIASGAQFTATVTDGNGGVDVKIVAPEGGVSTASPSFAVTADEGLTVTGNANGAEMTFNGEVVIKDLTSLEIMNVDGTVTVDGNNSTVIKTVNISGILNVVNGVFSATNATTFVTGNLSTAVASAESSDNGTATLGPLYVGIGIDNGKLVDGAPGTVSGNVTATIAYVSTDSVVPEKMTSGDGMKSTQFFVDDALWMTAYTSSGVNANVPNAPVKDAKFNGWCDVNGNTVYSDDIDGIASTDEIVVGAYDGKLYASIEYNVYNVQIIADDSIGSVAIDGVILAKNIMGYYSTTGLLTSGQHTVTYTLAAGYEGTATLSSVNVEVSGLTFILTGDFEGITYTLTLGGATYVGNTVVIDNGGSNDLGLTDYLLIILVILIAIMAIIVAMRLMRS